MNRLYIGALALASGAAVRGGAEAPVSLVARHTIVDGGARSQLG